MKEIREVAKQNSLISPFHFANPDLKLLGLFLIYQLNMKKVCVP